MKKISTALALTLTLVSSATAQTSTRLSAGKATEYGLVYTLPVTALDIYIEAELSHDRPGEFYNYAKRHLNITDAVTSESRSARVLGVAIVPRGIADRTQQWLAQFKNGSSVYMTLSPDNIPLTINADEGAAVAAPVLPVARKAAPTPLETPAARQAVTQEMARSASVSKKAELAAQQIFNLREMRSDILSGQADNPPADGAAMKLVLDDIAAQEAALTAMFAGTRTTSTVVQKMTFIPDSTDAAGRIIARLSAVDGIIDADNLAGAPITLDLRVLEHATLPTTDKGEPKSFPKGGVAYRIPGKALVTISYAGRQVAQQEVTLAQLGVVFGLNPALFSDKKEPYSLIFDPATGAALDLSPVK